MLNYISKNKNIKRDLGIIATIIILPFLFYIYTFIPNEENRTWKTSWFTLDSGYYEDVYYYCWLLSCKFFTLSLLSIWYISCIHKWKLILLFPILAEIVKIFFNIDYSIYNYVNYAFYYSIFMFVIYAYLLIYFSRKINYDRNKKSANEMLNNEINDQMILLNKIDLKEYRNLKSQKTKLKKKGEIDKKVYLNKLIALRDQLVV